MEALGAVERTLGQLYPYRVPLVLGALFLLGALAWWARRSGWAGRGLRGARQQPLVTAVALVSVLVVGTPVTYYLASPLWTRSMVMEESPLLAAGPITMPATPVAGAAPAATPGEGTSTVAPVFEPSTVLSGTWDGADEFHFARGQALIVEVEPGRYVLRVEDFSVRNGPDLFVYLSPEDGYDESAINLGELKATDGAFNYEIPEGVTLEEMRSAVVWCRRFAVLFGTALLAP